MKEVDGILVVAQELKEPLTTLRQLAFMLGEKDDANEAIRNEMIGVSERAIRQVNDLMKIQRLQDGVFEMEPVSVRAVCDDVMRELMCLFNANKQDLFVRYANRSPLVTANQELLHSVIYNFLLNAVHYSNDGAQSELMVKDFRDSVRVVVRDYGPALPMDVWREMKRGFIERPTSIAMRPGTSGLGLFIASRFSKYMHANVGAVRHRDGTSFYVELKKSHQMRWC